MRKFDDTKSRKKLNKERGKRRKEEEEGGRDKWGWDKRSGGGARWSGVEWSGRV
jgi:hypothetical protein